MTNVKYFSRQLSHIAGRSEVGLSVNMGIVRSICISTKETGALFLFLGMVWFILILKHLESLQWRQCKYISVCHLRRRTMSFPVTDITIVSESLSFIIGNLQK